MIIEELKGVDSFTVWAIVTPNDDADHKEYVFHSAHWSKERAVDLMGSAMPRAKIIRMRLSRMNGKGKLKRS